MQFLGIFCIIYRIGVKMEKFVLSTDSCCDEFKSKLRKENIECVSMKYILNEEIYADNADSEEDYEEFYNNMRSGKIYSTSALNMIELKEYFEMLLEKHSSDILHICLSSGLSGTFNVARQIANEINETSKHKVYVFDSLSATQVQNAMVYRAKALRNEGKTAEETLNILNDDVQHLIVYFFLNDLDALKRGGRINGVQAAMGKALQLRPVLTFDSEGRLKVVEKILGTKKAVKYLVDKLINLYDYEKKYPIFLAYAGENSCAEITKIIEEKIPGAEILPGPVGPVIASHTGPALTSVIFFSKLTRN